MQHHRDCAYHMNVNDIPQELIDLLDKRAGKKHSRDGVVLTTLAEILTLYNRLMICQTCRGKSLPHTGCRGGTWCNCQHRKGVTSGHMEQRTGGHPDRPDLGADPDVSSVHQQPEESRSTAA
jgi:hypothetical protein